MVKFVYGMRLRGFSIGCQPKDGFIERRDDETGQYYDILVYDRPLTEKEKDDFDLDELSVIHEANILDFIEALTSIEQFEIFGAVIGTTVDNWALKNGFGTLEIWERLFETAKGVNEMMSGHPNLEN